MQESHWHLVKGNGTYACAAASCMQNSAWYSTVALLVLVYVYCRSVVNFSDSNPVVTD